MSKLYVPHRELDRDMVARVAVELFDARTGKKQDEVAGENYITPRTLEHNRWKVREDFMGSMPGSNNTDTEPNYPIQEVWLSNSDRAIDVDSNFAEGEVFAWANKSTYVGGDAMRGSPNATECEADSTRAKWVFDWPTTAGNGTHRSVGWRSAAGTGDFSLIDGSLNVYSSLADTLTNFTGGICLLADGSYVVTAQSSQNFRKGSLNDIRDATAVTWGPTGSQVGVVAPGSVAVDDTDMYVTGGSGSSGGSVIRKFPIPTGVGAVTASSITVPGFSSLIGIAYDGTMLWVLDSSTGKMVRCDKSTGAIDREFTPKSGAVGCTFWPERGTLIVLLNSGKLCEYNMDGNLIMQAQYSWVGTGGGQPFIAADQMIGFTANFIGSTGTSRFHRGKPHVGSRVLLPSAITKTSLQTMKLTYTFTYA